MGRFKKNFETRNTLADSDHAHSSSAQSSPMIKKGPGQPALKVVDMNCIITKYFKRPHSTWSHDEKQEVAEYMRNRAGIDASDKSSISRMQLGEKFEYFLNQFIDLYETDSDFEAAIDPWQIIVIDKPLDNARYLEVLNRANRHINGEGDANDLGNPIQFQHNKDWILHIPNGREDARRVVSYMAGELHDTEFSAIVQDYRLSLRDV